MTKLRQKEIATQIIELVTEMVEDDSDTPVTAEPKHEKVELLTVKECAELISGLSVNTVRELEKQGKIKSTRAGKGIRGKILIYKDSLLDCLCK